MGQGFYTAIVWGSLFERDDLPEEIHRLIEELEYGGRPSPMRLRTSYESEQAWIGFMVADSDGNINTTYEPESEIGDFYPQIGFCFLNQTFPLREMESRISQANPDVLPNAKRAWEQFSLEMSELGINLPSPELLFVNDYD